MTRMLQQAWRSPPRQASGPWLLSGPPSHSTAVACLSGTSQIKLSACLPCMQVYDLAMEAALRGQSCGPRSLPIKGEWQWLLKEFAATYGIRDSYANLTFLRWILMWGPAGHFVCMAAWL